MANLSAISFHARKGFVTAGVSAKLSHVQELVAAALGHNTLASYQTASEDTALAGAAHVVLDTEGRPGFIRNPRKSLLTDGFDLEIFGVNYFNWWRQPGLWLNSGGSNNVPHTTLNN